MRVNFRTPPVTALAATAEQVMDRNPVMLVEDREGRAVIIECDAVIIAPNATNGVS